MFLPQCLMVKQTSSGKASLSRVQFLPKPLPPSPYASPPPPANSHLLDAIRFGRILAWGSEIWNYTGCGTWPLSHIIFYGNIDVPGNRSLDLFLSWLEPIKSHWHWHTLSDLKAVCQIEEVYWEGILNMHSQMMLFFCGCDSGQVVSVGAASHTLSMCLSRPHHGTPEIHRHPELSDLSHTCVRLDPLKQTPGQWRNAVERPQDQLILVSLTSPFFCNLPLGSMTLSSCGESLCLELTRIDKTPALFPLWRNQPLAHIQASLGSHHFLVSSRHPLTYLLFVVS